MLVECNLCPNEGVSNAGYIPIKWVATYPRKSYAGTVQFLYCPSCAGKKYGKKKYKQMAE